MTTQYAEEQGFKKKYLAPLIVLMLCAVSLTGAAYAYSTSITGHGAIDGDYYSIDMYSDNAGKTVISGDIDKDAFTVYTKKTVGEKYNAYVEKGTLTYETFVKVSTDIPNATFKLTAFAGYTSPTGVVLVNGVSSTGASTSTDVDITANVTLRNADDSADADMNALVGGTVYKVIIKISVGDDDTAFGTYDKVSDLEAALKLFEDKSAGFTFTLKADKN